MYTVLGIKRRLYYLKPNPRDIDIREIAQALSQTCRFCGRIPVFYSVAQHSILVSRHCSPNLKLYGLLHDAAEAYVGDLPWGLKMIIGTSYKPIENSVLRSIFKKYGLNGFTPPEVKEIDHNITIDELRFFIDETYWERGYRPILEKIDPWSALESKKQFLRRFNALMAGSGGT